MLVGSLDRLPIPSLSKLRQPPFHRLNDQVSIPAVWELLQSWSHTDGQEYNPLRESRNVVKHRFELVGLNMLKDVYACNHLCRHRIAREARDTRIIRLILALVIEFDGACKASVRSAPVIEEVRHFHPVDDVRDRLCIRLRCRPVIRPLVHLLLDGAVLGRNKT